MKSGVAVMVKHITVDIANAINDGKRYFYHPIFVNSAEHLVTNVVLMPNGRATIRFANGSSFVALPFCPIVESGKPLYHFDQQAHDEGKNCWRPIEGGKP